jgi:hypothetical protein
MRFGKKLVAAAAASIMMMGSASADFAGLYAGAHGSIIRAPLGGPIFAFETGAQAGYNFTPGNFVIGLGFDGGVTVIGGAAIFCCAFNATIRAGGLISPDVMLYALAGVGNNYVPAPGILGSVFGFGAEVAIGTSMGVFAEVRRLNAFGLPPISAFTQVRIGMNVHN